MSYLLTCKQQSMLLTVARKSARALPLALSKRPSGASKNPGPKSDLQLWYPRERSMHTWGRRRVQISFQILDFHKTMPKLYRSYGTEIVWDPASLGRSWRVSEMENREREIEEFMDITINNLKYQETTRGANDTRQKLVCASQMLGSGKTHFGQAFLAVAGSAPFRAKWEDKYSPADMEFVDKVLNSLYVYVDFSRVDYVSTLQRRIRNANTLLLNVISNLAVAKNPNLKETIEADWRRYPQKHVSVATIIFYFTKLLNQKIFVHIDEVDQIMDAPGCRSNLEQTLRPYYILWCSFLHPIVQNGICYVSGRSPYLYFVGKRLLTNAQQGSPSAVYHLFFDRFLLDNVKNIITHSFSNLKNDSQDLSPGDVDKLATLISYWTAGVPRLVINTLKYFGARRNNNIASLLSNPDTEWQLIYKFIKSNSEADIAAYQDLRSESDKKLYLQYAADALLRIPHKINNDSKEGPGSFKVVMETLWRLGLHTAKTPQPELDKDTTIFSDHIKQDGYFYTIFPVPVAMYLKEAFVLPNTTFAGSDYHNVVLLGCCQK